VLSKLGLGRFYSAKAKALQIPETYRGLQIITPRFVQDAHRRGVAVHVWTVNETADMSRLLNAGVDGIMTDYPDRLLRLLGRLESGK
jgi:glycerophosphoryl diester phosphodiesterase